MRSSIFQNKFNYLLVCGQHKARVQFKKKLNNSKMRGFDFNYLELEGFI